MVFRFCWPFVRAGESISKRASAEAISLAPTELDAIRDACQKRFDTGRPGDKPKVVKFEVPKTRVEKATEYARLTEIADYLNWLCGFLLGSAVGRDASTRIRQMVGGLNARRPPFKHRNQIRREYGFDDSQIDKLFEVITPGSAGNPFVRIDVQQRNNVIINALFYIGNRGGELLNLRIPDIKFDTNQILIARRADEAADPRLHQPLVKTLDRLVPMRDSLASLFFEYIFTVRKHVPHAQRNDYVFVNHKEGETQGQPLSISGYQKMIRTIANSALELADLHGHALRHTWNRRFSEFMDALENPQAQRNRRASEATSWGGLRDREQRQDRMAIHRVEGHEGQPADAGGIDSNSGEPRLWQLVQFSISTHNSTSPKRATGSVLMTHFGS